MTPRKAPSEEQLREAFVEVGDALQRAVVLSSDRVHSVLEDAVLRGRMTRRDAEELATSLVALGRDQALELRGEVDALARSLSGRVADAADAVAEVVPARARRKRRPDALAANGATPDASPAASPAASANGSVAAARAAELQARSAKDLIALVPTLPADALAELRASEEAGKARATVLRAIDAKLGA